MPAKLNDRGLYLNPRIHWGGTAAMSFFVREDGPRCFCLYRVGHRGRDSELYGVFSELDDAIVSGEGHKANAAKPRGAYACRGCNGDSGIPVRHVWQVWASFNFQCKNGYQTGWPICPDCAALWRRYGVSGRIAPIPVISPPTELDPSIRRS